jgi:hypothetical protein
MRCFHANSQGNVTYKSAVCKCLPSCQSVTVATEASTQPIVEQIMQYCVDDDEFAWYYTEEKVQNMNAGELYKAMAELGFDSQLGGNMTDIGKFCLHLSDREWSYITVGLATSTGLKVMQDVKVGITDKIAIVGKD